jgi:hypothetical protein
LEKSYPKGLKAFFLIHAIFAFVFGVIYLLIPKTFGTWVGVTILEPSTFRTVGAAILGFGVSSLMAYRESVWERVKIIVQMEITWTVLGVLATLYGIFYEGLAVSYWTDVLILGIFALAFGYFYARA